MGLQCCSTHYLCLLNTGDPSLSPACTLHIMQMLQVLPPLRGQLRPYNLHANAKIGVGERLTDSSLYSISRISLALLDMHRFRAALNIALINLLLSL